MKGKYLSRQSGKRVRVGLPTETNTTREEIEKIRFSVPYGDYLVSSDDEVLVRIPETVASQILTLLDKEIQKARIDEMNRMIDKLKSGKWKSFATEVTERKKQLEKGEK